MKTTIFRYSDCSIETTNGLYPRFGVAAAPCENLEFCEPIEVELPEGYEVVECLDGKLRLQNPTGSVCELATNKDHGFWIYPMTGSDAETLYVHVDAPVWDGHKFGPYVATREVK